MCLVSFALKIKIALKISRQTDTIYVDFKVAFNSLPLDLLVVKLDRLGVGGLLLLLVDNIVSLPRAFC